MAIRPAHEAMRELMKILGISGPVSRIVIDMDARDVVKVYVQRYLHEVEEAGVVKALAHVDGGGYVECVAISVDDKGNVTHHG